MTPTAKAALWMLGAIASFSSMAVAGRQLAGQIDSVEIIFWRSIIGIFLVLAAARATGRLHEITRDKLGLHLLRNISHFGGQSLWYFAVGFIPLAQLFALEFASPIYAILLSALLLGDHLSRRGLISSVVGFVGVLIVTRPGATEISWPVIAGALSAIGFALSAVFTRRLTRTASVVAILFWLVVMQAVLGLGASVLDGTLTVPSATAWPWVLVISFAGLFAHFCLTMALGLAPASVVMPIDFARLPIIAIIGMSFYAEPFDPFVFLGGLVIFASNYYNIRGRRKS